MTIMTNIIFQKKQSKGFSIIELIVALGIFSIVITVVAIFFNNSIISQRRIISSQNIQDNIRYAIEFISREIRMGKDFNVGEGAQSLGGFLVSDTLSFTNANGKLVTYSWDKNIQSQNYHLILRNGNPIISPQVEVDDFKFFISQDSAPKITIYLEAKLRGAKKLEEKVPLRLQTTISPRGF